MKTAEITKRQPAAGAHRASAEPHPQHARRVLVEELYRNYAAAGPHRRRLRAIRTAFKKYSWIAVVAGTTGLKRFMDIAVAGLALIILSPVFLVVALAVRLYDGGPALFWQKRVGQWGREFRFPKFRSMVVDSERMREKILRENQHGDSITFKIRRDPRITRPGAIIRKLSLDELPQLWCVLRGEMSLVGPRPPLPAEVARYTPADRRRLDVKPGLTCIWQVSGRSELAFDKQLSLDVQYIDSHSLWLDIALLLKTVPAILSGRGAY